MQQREHFYGQLKYPGGWKTCQLTPGAVIWATHHQLPHRVQALLGHDAYNPFQSTLCHTHSSPKDPTVPWRGGKWFVFDSACGTNARGLHRFAAYFMIICAHEGSVWRAGGLFLVLWVFFRFPIISTRETDIGTENRRINLLSVCWGHRYNQMGRKQKRVNV